MSSLGSTSTTWAVIVIVIVPLVIIAASELDERFRQRESPLRGATSIIRAWLLPFFAIWALLVPVLGVDPGSLPVQLAGTGVLFSIAAAVQSALRVIIGRTRNRMTTEDGRKAPELLLMLPRLGVIITTGWVLLESVWGIDLSSALTALGVTSLVISFALQDTLSGLASGMLLLSDQPIQPGHWVRVGDTEGVVVDINWRTTRIQDRNGDVIIVPNSELAGSSIINFTASDSRHRVVVPVQVAFVNPPTLAKAMLLDAALSTQGVLADPPPRVVVTQTDDPLMGYEVQMWVEDYAIAPQVKSDFGGLVWYQSHRHEVPLPSPAQDLFLHDGATAGSSNLPTQAELRNALQQSPLLSSVGDAELDRLAHAGRAARYAVGEFIADTTDDGRDMVVIENGRAELVLHRAGRAETVIAELGPGEIGGLMSETIADHDLAIRAVTDCEIVIVDRLIVEEIASKSADLAAALNRLSSIRRRRAERILAQQIKTDSDIPVDGTPS